MSPAFRVEKIGPGLYHVLRRNGAYYDFASTSLGARWKVWRLNRRSA